VASNTPTFSGHLTFAFKHEGLWAILVFQLDLVDTLRQAITFCGSTYTTVGYNSDLMPEGWKVMTMIIALSGMFSFAWTTGIMMMMLRPFHAPNTPASPAGTHKTPPSRRTNPRISRPRQADPNLGGIDGWVALLAGRDKGYDQGGPHPYRANRNGANLD
jgi:hypothetical protein